MAEGGRGDDWDGRTACAAVLRPALACARAQGVDVDALLADLKIPPSSVDDIDERISEATHDRAWRETAARTGDPSFGLHVAEHAGLGAFDILDYAFWSSATFEEVIRRCATFHRLLCDALAFTLEMRGGTAHLRPASEGHGRHSTECFFALIVHRGRELTGRAVAPRDVRFAHAAPRDVAPHAALFRCPVRFGCGASELAFDVSDLSLPVQSAKPGLAAILDRQMRGMLAALPKAGSFMTHVRSVVADGLRGGGRPTLQSTARALKASARTLQRRLREHGTTHREVVDTVRRELAERFLGMRRMSITEIAFLLGFTDVSGFRRTFRRWTGRSPAVARSLSA